MDTPCQHESATRLKNALTGLEPGGPGKDTALEAIRALRADLNRSRYVDTATADELIGLINKTAAKFLGSEKN